MSSESENGEVHTRISKLLLLPFGPDKVSFVTLYLLPQTCNRIEACACGWLDLLLSLV